MRRILFAVWVAAAASCGIDDRNPGAAPGGTGGMPDTGGTGGSDGNAGGGGDAGASGTSGNGGSAGDGDGGLTCSGCVIDAMCVPEGSTQPDNPCQACDPELDAAGYSANPAADGTSCGLAGAGLLCVAGECAACSAASDPDALCAGRFPALPVCDAALGRCAACLAADCSGAEPVCDPSAGCRACNEHADCPASACHLSGASQGECFALSEVVQVPDADVLRTQVAILVTGEPRVLRLAPTSFVFDDILSIGGAGTELAIIGQPGAVFTGGPTNGAPPLISLGFDSILYLAQFTISQGPTNAINSSSGAILWLDDMRIDGYPNVGVSGTSEGYIRRSRIRAGATALLWQGGSLVMHTTSLGPGAATGFRTTGGPSLDVRYVTIAGNTTSLGCDASPGPSGVIRNSLLAGTADPAVSGAACELLTYVGNAVDQAGFGALIAHYESAWFTGADSSDFHLTSAGATAVGAAATWSAGDPALDIDSERRPSAGVGVAGVDEP